MIKCGLLTRTGLLLCFVLGAALVFMGQQGQSAFTESGFASESAYDSIYSLSADVAEAWNGALKPELDRLSAQEREGMDSIARTLASRLFDGAAEGTAEETWQMLYAGYLTGGPKVTSAARKAVTALKNGDAALLRQSLIRCMLNGEEPVPAQAEKLVGGTSGEERQAALMQALFVSLGSAEGDAAEHVSQFKKSVRGKEQQETALRMIGGRKLSGIWRVIVSRSRTVMLIGVLLMLNAVLLALLMRSERRWAFDVKWLVILLIVDFLLVFQLLPVIYMTIKGMFPEGRLSLSAFRRLYSYPLNLEALKNTLIASVATMLLGTAIAFPLAWLVGRTDLYGRKFFRALFVMTYMVPPYVGAMAWLRLTNPNVGVVNQWLRALLHLGSEPGPLNVYTLPGLIWVLTTFY